MAGLNFIGLMGAAVSGDATKEIDFVPHILSCSPAQRHVSVSQDEIYFSPFLYLCVEGGLTIVPLGGMKYGSRASGGSG